MQTIRRGADALQEIWKALEPRRIFLVCGGSFDTLPERRRLLPGKADVTRFSMLSPNPRFEEVEAGIETFRGNSFDALLAVGGGSAIDVAKCVKLYSRAMVPFIAVPTTAGTGSESTRHAVVYRDGVKQSISDEAIVPDYAVLVPELLERLPDYQKKCTMLDALCQGIESWWSVHATEESIVFAKAAVSEITANWRAYIRQNDAVAAAKIMDAANASGRAINITATTAPHAMSYKLTSLYGIPHGHAVALCMREVWPYLASHAAECIDPRGPDHLKRVLTELADVFSFDSFCALLDTLEIERPIAENKAEEATLLSASVNPERLSNNPVRLDTAVLRDMYERIIR